ncbi:P-loop NTPase [Caldalkalibacillus salinus]|uniref:P-loop NTPase n=1 Tax=Caldalkalibacillus salinus TaxID=2803787 RepID=UPI001923ECC2
MRDQAEKLRERLLQPQESTHTDAQKTKVITVCSGKGGVGKSNFSLNFAIGLAQQGKKVMIFDLDIGLANLDVLMGVNPKRTLTDMVEEELSIWDIVEDGPMGVQFVAGGSGFQHLLQMNEAKVQKLIQELLQLHNNVDYIILDTGAGISHDSLRFILAADDVIIVTTPEPTAITDAYAVLKMIYLNDDHAHVQLVINRCTSMAEGKSTGEKLKMVTRQFLDKEVTILGHIQDDPNVLKAVKKQHPFLLLSPITVASKAILNICRHYLDMPTASHPGIKGFIKKILKQSI